jgi:hypothetical protein
MPQRQVFHVVPQDHGKWRVEPAGSREVGRVFEDKDEAIRQATENAKAAETGQIIVHGQDGHIQYERTYGEDPRERKG